MKKYKLLKYIEDKKSSIKIGETFETKPFNTDTGKTFIDLDDGSSISAEFLIKNGFIEEVVENSPVEDFIWKIMDNLGNHTPIVENILKEHIKDNGKEEVRKELETLKKVISSHGVNYNGIDEFLSNYIIIKTKND